MNINKQDRDKLRELARAAESEVIRSHGWAGSVEMLDALRIDEEYLTAISPSTILALLDMIDRPAASGDGWISVKDRRPTDHTKCYLVDSNWGIRLARKHEDNWANGCFQDTDTDSDEGMLGWDQADGVFTVTHWCELPPGPNEQAASAERAPAEPAAYMFDVQVKRLGQRRQFAAIDYTLDADETLVSKTPLFYAAERAPVVGLTHEQIKAAGGIVHKDGNIFFTNIDKLNACLAAANGEQK